MDLSGRRGACHPNLVPCEVREALEAGHESANHMEQIAMDMGNLLRCQFPALADRAHELRELGLVARMRKGGQLLYEELGLETAVDGPTWGSDTSRGWAAMAIGFAPELTLRARLRLVRPFAEDPHFAVREWAWLSIRPHIVPDVPAAVVLLEPWARSSSDRARRFASEVTRPRGVWSVHLTSLKRDPGIALPLLHPLRADRSRYVQDSVSNWLNDASRTRSDWVIELCTDWLSNCDSPATRRICRRALRSRGSG